MKFRALKADEIELRIGSVAKDGKSCTVLLYKDARCDMAILDETVGEENWQRDHKEVKGNLFCGVSIWDDKKAQWITKWDCGTESYTEKEKGESSDSFKRACFNWGIGRELYTSPYIKITAGNGYDANTKRITVKIKEIETVEENGKRFISKLTLYDWVTKKEVFTWSRYNSYSKPAAPVASTPAAELATPVEKKTFMDTCKLLGVNYVDILRQAGVTGKMTKEQHGKAMIILKEIEDNKE